MKKTFCHVMFLFLVSCTAAFAAVENSIIPMMEKFECIENLPSNKFTKKQFAEIAEALEKKEDKIRIVTYNMLFNIIDHKLAEENRWPNRLPRIVELMKTMQPDVICTQELYPSQVQELTELLQEDFAVFTGQKNAAGETYGIFYRKKRFELLSSKVNDQFAMLQLKDLKTDKLFSVCNTHMPFSNIEKRELYAHDIVKMARPLSKEMAVIYTGDLNTFPNRLDMPGLPFYDGDYIHNILSKGPLKNSHERALLGHFGPISTFTNTETELKPFIGTGTPGIILDYIYVSRKVTVLTHGVEKGTVDGHFPSDHMPVVVDFLIK